MLVAADPMETCVPDEEFDSSDEFNSRRPRISRRGSIHVFDKATVTESDACPFSK